MSVQHRKSLEWAVLANPGVQLRNANDWVSPSPAPCIAGSSESNDTRCSYAVASLSPNERRRLLSCPISISLDVVELLSEDLSAIAGAASV